jgi:hypothetical protein
VLFSPAGVAGWLMLHQEALRRGEVWRLAPSYALVAPAIAAGLVGAVMIIEMTRRVFAQEPIEAIRLFGFDVNPASVAPWIVAVALVGAGVGFGRLLWPKVGDAWGALDMRLRKKAEA